MSFGNILGQIMQNGMGGRNPTRSRVDNVGRNLGGSGGTDQLMRQLQSALGGRSGGTGAGGALGGGMGASSSGGSGGGFADRARDFLGGKQAGGMTGAQIGGIGAAAGGLLGGGLGGAARGGALAILGTLALSALKNSGNREVEATPEEAEILTSPDTERLLVRAMVSAAKSDGQIDQGEMTRILGKLEGEDVTPDERQYVLDEMGRPSDPRAVAAEVTSPAQAAEVYAASLMAIEVDSEAERSYLRDLATALDLDAGTVERLHSMTGAPAA